MYTRTATNSYQSNAREKRASTERKHCHYCKENIAFVDFKEIPTLRRFTSSYFKIAPPRRSGLCAKHQRKVARAVKRARIAGLMSYLPQ